YGHCEVGWECLYCHHAEHRNVLRPTKRLRLKLRGLTVPSKLLLLRNCLEIKSAKMPRWLPSIQALQAIIEDAWATADQQSAIDVRFMQGRASNLPISALLGDHMIGDFEPLLYNSIQEELTRLKMTSPVPVRAA
ncbi:unnamed protein product, partial [Symbiodinium sp. CCMP2456]